MNESNTLTLSVSSFCDTVTKHVFTFPGEREAVVESVLYRYPDFKTRTVICCSVQSGCPIGCTFCGTGRFFIRNLTAAEIVEQPMTLLREVVNCNPADIGRLQIMFMSMGEPGFNLVNLCEAIQILHREYPNASLLVSTMGPRVDWEPLLAVSREISQVGLQFSIHEATDAARSEVIPYKNKLSLTEIAELGAKWAACTGRKPFCNYCVKPGNDTEEHVSMLKAIFDPDVFCFTLSVICEANKSMKDAHDLHMQTVQGFAGMMASEGYDTRLFNPAGQDDIGGGCGQLWYFQEWLKTRRADSTLLTGVAR